MNLCPKCGRPVIQVATASGREVLLEEGAGRFALQLTIDGARPIAVRVRRASSHRRHKCLAYWRRRCVLL